MEEFNIVSRTFFSKIYPLKQVARAKVESSDYNKLLKRSESETSDIGVING